MFWMLFLILFLLHRDVQGSAQVWAECEFTLILQLLVGKILNTVLGNFWQDFSASLFQLEQFSEGADVSLSHL